jgi:hypothetical protein
MQAAKKTALVKSICKTNAYKRSIFWHPVSNSNKILQIYNKGLEFALVSNEYEQCHPFVWCKDFLHDVVFSTVHNKAFDLYKFQYDPSISPKACLRETRVLVTNSKDKKLSENVYSCLEFLNQVEDRFKIPRTKLRECSNCPKEYKYGVFLFQGNKRWLQSPPMLSLYTLLIRTGFSHLVGTSYLTTINMIKQGHLKPYQSKDAKWLSDMEPAMYKILRLGDRKIFYKDIKRNYPLSISIETIHNKLGIMGFASDMIMKAVGQNVYVPYWHRLK